MLFNLKKLVSFYDTKLGRFVKRQIKRQLRSELDQLSNSSYLLSLGYSIPFLGRNWKKFYRFNLFFPATQGCFTFGDEKGNLSALVHENQLPLPDAIVDGMVCSHCFEHTHDEHQLLREIWRVLNGSGKLYLILPNRRGLWARFDNNPYGFGTSYSKRQIRKLLEQHQFIVESVKPVLFAPPSHMHWYHSLITPINHLLKALSNQFCGVYIITAKKQIFQPVMKSSISKINVIEAKNIPSI